MKMKIIEKLRAALKRRVRIYRLMFGREHKMVEMKKNEDGTNTIVCSRGCQTQVRVFKHEGDATKTLGDRLKVESTNCPYYEEFKMRHGQPATEPLPRAETN